MEISQLLGLRLTNQRIIQPDSSDPHDIAAHLGAVQAQDLTSALWSIGLRLPGSKASDIIQAISDRRLVWTWAMRGTLHIVAAEDIRWMLTLLAPRAIAKTKGIYRQAGLTDELFTRAYEILQHALRGGKRLTRKQIVELWETEGISTTQQRGYLMLARFAQEARICLGPPEDKAQTFVLLDEWVTDAISIDHNTSLTEIAKRYFMSHGPATLDDFAWWTGLTRTECRRGLEAAMTNLTSVVVAGKEYYYAPATGQTLLSSTLRLLPGFDEYMLGYTDRSLALRDTHRHHVYTKNAVYPGTLLIDGQVEGTWKRVVQGQKIHFTISPFRKLTVGEQSKIEEQCMRYGIFWEKPATIEFLA